MVKEEDKQTDSKECEKRPHLYVNKDEVIRFARVLLELAKPDERENWFKGHGIDYDNYVSSNVTFARWKQAFLSLVFKQLTDGNEFMGFDGHERCSPSFEIMEYRSDKSELLPVIGYSVTTYNERKFILHINYSAYACWINVYHNKE